MVLSVAEAKKLTVPRLKEELSKRGLDSSGNKPDLLTRLVDSIEKAAEDSILNDNAGEALLNDDILNDDILDAPSLDGDDADNLLNGSLDAETPAAEPTTTTTDTTTKDQEEEESKRPALDDIKLARAARFGLPVTGTATAAALASDAAKNARAARFGLTATATSLGSDDAKQKRAARFGLDTSSGTPSDTSINEKKAARAARFGLPLNSNNKKALTEEETKKLTDRAKRFGMIDEDAEAKKKARLERFGGAN